MALWIKKHGACTSLSAYPISTRYSGSTEGIWMRCFSARFSFYIYMYDSVQSKYSNAPCGTDIVDDTWIHVTMVWPGNNGPLIYYDGNNVLTSNSWTDTTTAENTQRELYFGKQYSSSSNSVSSATYDELKLYNAVLDASAVQALYNSYP